MTFLLPPGIKGLNNVTGFLTSGNHFLPFSLDRSQLLAVEAVNCSTKAYFSVNPSFRLVKSSFCLLKTALLYCQIFLPAETMIEMRGQLIFKEEPLDTNFFRTFLKWRQLFLIVATYFSISFIQLVETDFAPSRNSIFLGQSYFAASRNHYWN